MLHLLPKEIHHIICSYFDKDDVFSLALTSFGLAKNIREYYFGKYFLVIDFNSSFCPLIYNYSRLHKECYRAQNIKLIDYKFNELCKFNNVKSMKLINIDINIKNIFENKNMLKLCELALCSYFNQSLDGLANSFPNLHTLTFGFSFNQSLDGLANSLPKLHTLTFGEYFNQSLDGLVNSLPKLHTLTFGEYFNQSLDGLVNSLPNLHILTFEYDYDKQINKENIPASLKKIIIGNKIYNI